MADRVVKVTLSAQVADYRKSMLEAAQATRAVGTEGEKLAQVRQAMSSVGAAGLAMGTAFALGIGVAVARYAEFDQAMSAVMATGEDAVANQEALRDAAIEAGASTVFSATESANAIEELLKAGVAAADVLGGGLKGALDLAAAGGLGVAEAAGIAATTLQQFKLEGSDATHVADLLAAGAAAAMGDVTDMGQALNQAGLVSNQFGLSVEETVGTLSAFASAGMLGSDAGTAFRTMLLRLANPTDEVRSLMADLGIEAYDASGSFIGMAGLAGELETSLAGMTQAQRDQTLAMVFGQDAIRGANVLLGEGAAGIRDWTAAVDDQGFAADMAAKRLDNLAGDWEALQGAIDAALIQTGGAGNDALRGTVQTLTALVDVYNNLPEPAKGATLAIAAGASAVGLVGGATLLAVPRIADFKNGLQTLGVGMGRVALTAGGVGLAIGGLMAVVTTLAQRHATAVAAAQGYADAIAQGGDAAKSSMRDQAVAALELEDSWLWLNRGSAFDAAKKLGADIDDVTDAALGQADALDKLALYTRAADGDQDALSEVMKRTGLSYVEASSNLDVLVSGIRRQNDAVERGRELDEQRAEATEDGVGVTESAAAAYIEAADGAQALNDELTQLIEQVNKANGVGQDAITANLSYRDALAKVDEAIASGNVGLDENTQLGRDNLGMLNDLASKAQDAALRQLELDGNTDAYTQTMQASRDALIQRAQDLGYTADEAKGLADQIFRIPTKRELEVIAHTAEAERRLQALRGSLAAFQNSSFGVNVSGYIRDLDRKDGGYSTGGRVRGPGNSTSDSIPAWLSDGEHVLTAAEVNAAGGHEAVEQWREALLSGSHRRTPDGPAIDIDRDGDMGELVALFDQAPALEEALS